MHLVIQHINVFLPCRLFGNQWCQSAVGLPKNHDEKGRIDTVIVARYKPMANTVNTYRKNVMPPKARGKVDKFGTTCHLWSKQMQGRKYQVSVLRIKQGFHSFWVFFS